MKVTDERLEELIVMYEWYVSNVDVRTAEFKEFEDILSTLKELQLKYAEEAGAACEEMKYGIEAVISELEDETISDNIVDDLDLGELGGISYAIRTIKKHLSKHLDE